MKIIKDPKKKFIVSFRYFFAGFTGFQVDTRKDQSENIHTMKPVFYGKFFLFVYKRGYL